MEKIKDNILYVIGGLIFALSSSILSLQLIVVNYYEKSNIIITFIVSFLCAIYFWIKTSKSTIKLIKNNISFSIICSIVMSIIIAQLYLTKGIECKEISKNWIFNIFRIKSFIFSLISLIYIGIFIGEKIKKWIIEFYKSLDLWDKRAYMIATIICFIVILIAYCTNNKWFLQYDKVYSLDSEWCFNKIFPMSTYYDIRHPILSIFTFPIWAIVHTLVNIIFPSNLSELATAIILQLINAQLLILIGLQIKILTKNKFVFVLYMLSFSTILYGMFFEKYQLCVFLIVLYVFSICNKKHGSIPTLVGATGGMPTSCFIGVAELLKSGKVKEKISRILKIIIVTICTFIVLGRAHLLKNGISEITTMREQFSNETYTVKEKLISTTKMFQSSLVALPSSTTVRENMYWWENLESKISFIAIIIIGVMIVGAIVNRKELFVKIATVWSIFALILFVILNWSTQETPLFTIYFSWAIIPLFVMGLDFIIKKLKMNPKIIYGIIMIFITVINIITIFDIQDFLTKL